VTHDVTKARSLAESSMAHNDGKLTPRQCGLNFGTLARYYYGRLDEADYSFTKQDRLRAVELWERGAEVGDPDSAYQLAVRLFHGDDVLPKDCDRAVQLYKIATAAGVRIGTGFSDRNTAIRSLTAATEHGDMRATDRLQSLLQEEVLVEPCCDCPECGAVWLGCPAWSCDACGAAHRDPCSRRISITGSGRQLCGNCTCSGP